MKSNFRNDNRVRITGGGACFLYKTVPNYISRISRSIRGPDLAISKGSMTQKEWRFPTDLQVGDSLVEAAGGSMTLAKLMVKRGIRTVADIQAFLDPAQYTPTSPMDLPDMPRAVVRVTQAITNKEKITIYGDYDVDGVTATAVMVCTLRLLGAEVDYYIPSRAEGYGLNLKAVSVLASKHRSKLIISCDCGISNFSEINFARSLGVDTIVVDHHSMPDLLPPAAAILHPKQLDEEHPFFHLPGVGVAYKLAEALLIDSGRPEEVEKLLDFVTLGMIADMVPLTKECRYLVQVGMSQLVNSERAGIKALLNQVTTKGEGTDLVGFGLAPRINAVGRLSDANLAVKLMITDDVEEADKLARQLELENERRQEMCEQIFFQADQKVAHQGNPANRAIAIYDADWHHGVVGIVASRLVEKYHCPVFIGELDESEGIVKGSARGISGIDLYEVLKANEHLALKWGGHKMAAGFSVEAGKADLFCKGIVETCNRMLAEQSLRPTLDIDLEVEPDEVTEELVQTLSRLAPFGMANKKPVLAMRGQSCKSTRILGREGKHSRVMLTGPAGIEFECVFWNSRGRVPADGQLMDAAFMPEMNHYNGNSRLQLVLADWRDPNKPLEPTVVAKSAPAVAASAAGPKTVPITAGPNGVMAAPIAAGAKAAPNTAGANGVSTASIAGGAQSTPSTDGPKGVSIASIAGGAQSAPITAGPKGVSIASIAEGAKSAEATAGAIGTSNAAAASSEWIIGDAKPGSIAAGANVITAADAYDNDELASDLQDMTPPAAQSVQHAPTQSFAPDLAAVPPAARPLVWKDLRGHGSAESLVQAALRKLGTGVAIFGEACPKLNGATFVDRSALAPVPHVVFWSFPPNVAVFKSVLEKTGAQNIYLIGAVPEASDDPAGFLKRLLGLVRFAVNQREGQADPEKVSAALGTTKMGIALGLTILKKINLIDWFAEDGCLFLDLLGEPTGKAEELPEFRQLANCLREVTEFRSWCSQAPLNEIQLALVPELTRTAIAERPEITRGIEQDSSGIYQHDTTNHVPSNFQG